MSSLSASNQVSLEIGRLLKQQNLTHAELARRLGVSRPAVSRMLSPSYDGHSVPSLRRIADALGVESQIEFLEASQK